jgi:hypothetical protein
LIDLDSSALGDVVGTDEEERVGVPNLAVPSELGVARHLILSLAGEGIVIHPAHMKVKPLMRAHGIVVPLLNADLSDVEPVLVAPLSVGRAIRVECGQALGRAGRKRHGENSTSELHDEWWL